MKVIATIKEMQALIKKEKKQAQTIGFVPTMGFLHDGHISLMRQARAQNDSVVLSIFVNPLQFGPNEDFAAYPRDFERDQQLAKEEGVDYLFYPTVEEMYPRESSVTVHVKARTDVLCGQSRPGHFDGVATVLTKLFHIISPDRVYFGMKDAQQVAVVDGLVTDFNFPLEIVPVDTVREADGLAKSSRNVNLSLVERREATVLYESLLLAKELIVGGESKQDVIISSMKTLIESNSTGKIDYIKIYSFPSLTQMPRLEGKIIIALAVQFKKARLIDNLILEIKA